MSSTRKPRRMSRSKSVDAVDTFISQKQNRLQQRKQAMFRRAKTESSGTLNQKQSRRLRQLRETASTAPLDQKNARWESQGTNDKQDRAPRCHCPREESCQHQAENSGPTMCRWNSNGSLDKDKDMGMAAPRRQIKTAGCCSPPKRPSKQSSFELQRSS